MSDFMLMEPANQTFAELLSNGTRYTVPRFQRDYSWEQEQWEELWADIASLAAEGYHYMGYIVLQRKNQHEFEVIDGQQRLVTLSLIVLAAMQHLRQLVEKQQDADNNNERLQEITNRYIGSKDIASLRVSSKLTLNRNNGRFYRDICSNLKAPDIRGVTLTNSLLKQAFNFFSNKSIGENGAEIGEFINTFSNRMLFTKIVVQDNLNAYKVFETLNARGVQLSTPDLLKNYLFSVVTQNDDVADETLDDLDETWSALLNQLGENSFTGFVRYHYNAHQSFVTKKELFKSVRQQYHSKTKAYQYLQSLTDSAPIYASLSSPFDEWWQKESGLYREAIHYLEGLKLFGIRQPFTVLMVAYQYFSAEEFIKTVHYMYILSIRYNVVCRFSSNEQERRYSQIAIKITRNELKRASHIKNSEAYKTLYPDDDAFCNAFEFLKMPSRRSSKKIRFLLAEIERYCGRSTRHSDTTLEHICPYNPEQNWYQYFGEGVNDVADRLGNMVLLEKDELKRSDFETKKQAYQASNFNLAKKVSEYRHWDLANLNSYQFWLAEQAVQTWRVDYQ